MPDSTQAVKDKLDIVSVRGWELWVGDGHDPSGFTKFKCSRLRLMLNVNAIPTCVCGLTTGRDIKDPAKNTLEAAERLKQDIQKHIDAGEPYRIPCQVREYIKSRVGANTQRIIFNGYIGRIQVEYNMNTEDSSELWYGIECISSVFLLIARPMNYQFEVAENYLLTQLTGLASKDNNILLTMTTYNLETRSKYFCAQLQKALQGTSIVKRIAMCAYNARRLYSVFGGVPVDFEAKLDTDVLAAFAGTIKFNPDYIKDNVDVAITQVIWTAISDGIRNQDLFHVILGLLSSPDFMLKFVPKMVDVNKGNKRSYIADDVLSYIESNLTGEIKASVTQGLKMVILPDTPATKKPKYEIARGDVLLCRSTGDLIASLREYDVMLMVTNIPGDWGFKHNPGRIPFYGLAGKTKKLTDTINAAFNGDIKISIDDAAPLTLGIAQAPKWAWACIPRNMNYLTCNQAVNQAPDAAKPQNASQQEENINAGKTDAAPAISNIDTLQKWLNAVAYGMYVTQRDRNKTYEIGLMPTLHFRSLSGKEYTNDDDWMDQMVGETVTVDLTPSDYQTQTMLIGVVAGVVLEYHNAYISYKIVLDRVRFYDENDTSSDLVVTNLMYKQ